MPVGDDTVAYRRRLPHLTKRERMYFVTFCTRQREILPARARDEVLASCIHEHERSCWLDCAVVMPDHVHLLLAPNEDVALPAVLGSIKSAAAHRVNKILIRSGSLWQQESFDRMIRKSEDFEQKREYVCNNPVRAGLVSKWREYRWIWLPP